MSGGWIKFDKDMPEDPRLLVAAAKLTGVYQIGMRTSVNGGAELSAGDALRFARNALLGALMTFWDYADTHIRDDDSLPIDAPTLDALVGLDGFCGLMPPEWLKKTRDGTLLLPGYCAKNDLISKRKRAADNRARQAAWRDRRNASRNGLAESSPPRDVTRYAGVTKSVDQDLDQDLDLKKQEGKGEARSARPQKAVRIPDDFELTEGRRATAKAEHVDPDREFARFRDYWRAAGGANARKLDWDATWRNWCRKAADIGAAGGTPAGRPYRPSPTTAELEERERVRALERD